MPVLWRYLESRERFSRLASGWPITLVPALKRRGPLYRPEEGVVCVCSGSAQIAKLHDRNQKEGNNKPNREERDYSQILCDSMQSIRTRLNNSRFFVLCVYVSRSLSISISISSFQLLVGLLFGRAAAFFSHSDETPRQIKQFCSALFFQIGEHTHQQKMTSSQTNV